MKKNIKLLILAEEEIPTDRRLGSRMNRRQALNAIRSSGAKVHHDSGGRLIVIEASDKAEKALTKRLPKADIKPIDFDARETIVDLDPTESLFLEALKIRNSESYRKAKKLRKYGETPEEKELVSASCVREEY